MAGTRPQPLGRGGEIETHLPTGQKRRKGALGQWEERGRSLSGIQYPAVTPGRTKVYPLDKKEKRLLGQKRGEKRDLDVHDLEPVFPHFGRVSLRVGRGRKEKRQVGKREILREPKRSTPACRHRGRGGRTGRIILRTVWGDIEKLHGAGKGKKKQPPSPCRGG